MAYSYEIDDKQELAILSCTKERGLAELCNGLDRLISHSEFGGVKKVLAALTYESCRNTSNEEVRSNARVTKAALRNKPFRIAIVAPHDLTYGLCRMFVSFASNGEINVFRNQREACDWLQVVGQDH